MQEHEEQTSTSIGDSDGNLLDWLYSTIAAVSPRMSMPGLCSRSTMSASSLSFMAQISVDLALAACILAAN